MELELVSFKLCPFVQRAVILLKLQKIDFKATYIDLMDPPDWFKEISPTGQVPLLKVDNHIIFESSVIGEFINDIGATDLYPSQAVEKAMNRSWIAFSSTLFNELFSLVTSDEEKFNATKKSLFERLNRIEQIKSQHDFFNNNQFSMVDAAIAPFFMRLSWINELTNDALSIKQFTKLESWCQKILALDVVKNSVVEGTNDAYHSDIKARKRYLSTLLVN